jgi:hypothetical protein
MMPVDFESQFLQTVEVLSDVSAPDLALRLYLQCAQVYDHLDFGVSTIKTNKRYSA